MNGDPERFCSRRIIVTNNSSPELMDFNYQGDNNIADYKDWRLFGFASFRDVNQDITALKLSYDVFANGVKRTDKSFSKECSVWEDQHGSYKCAESIPKSHLVPNGTYKFKIEASDSQNNTTTHSFSVLVKEKNTPPSLSVKWGGAEVTEGTEIEVAPDQNLTLDVNAYDGDDAFSNQIDKIELDAGNGFINASAYNGGSCYKSGRDALCTGLVIPVTTDISPLRVRVNDRAGASMMLSFNVKITPPPAVTLKASKVSPFFDEPVTLTATASHASGLKEYKICKAQGDYQSITNGCAIPVRNCSIANSNCTITLDGQDKAGEVTYYAYVVPNIGKPNAANRVLNYISHYGISVSSPSKSLFVIGRDKVDFTVHASAFSHRTANGELPKLSSLTLKRNGSPVSGGVTISPLLNSFVLPMASDQAGAQKVHFSWNPSKADAGDNIELTLVAKDNDGHEVTARLPDIKLFDPVPTEPSVPNIALRDLGAGLVEVKFTQLNNTNDLVMRATMNGGEYLMKDDRVSVDGTSYTTTIQTKVADHGKLLRVSAYGIALSSHKNVSGQEGSAAITVVNHEAKPLPPVFDTDITQVGGPYALSWLPNNDGVTKKYKLVYWKGLPSDKFNAAHVTQYEGPNINEMIWDIHQGRFTYELHACNSQDVCTTGQQHTIEHIAPYIDSASITPCDSADGCSSYYAKVSITGVGFNAYSARMTVIARMRRTGETFPVFLDRDASQMYTLGDDGYTLSGKVNERVLLGLLNAGVELVARNGVHEDDKPDSPYLQNKIILDKTGSAQRPRLREREYTVSENGVLYMGKGPELSGLWAYKFHTDKEPDFLGRYNEPESDLYVTAKPLVRQEPVSDVPNARKVDNIYFGSLNRHFYRVVHDPLSSIEMAKKWQFKTQGEIQAGAQLDQNGVLLVGSMDEALYSLNPKDGLVNWHYTFPRSGGVVMQPLVSASGHIYVTTQDGELHVIDDRMIGSNAVTWQNVESLASQFSEAIRQWEAQQWQPEQNTDGVVKLTKAMLILLQRTPSKAEVSFMAYLVANGHPFNEVINVLIKANPALSESTNAQFISALFEYLLVGQDTGQVLSGSTYGSGDQAYWVDILEQGVTRADVIIDLLGASEPNYEQATFNLLKYFYGRCLVGDNCHFDYDTDGDGLSDEVENEIGTNPADGRDGLPKPSLDAIENNGLVDFTMTATGQVEEYELYGLKPGSNQFVKIGTVDADRTAEGNSGTFNEAFIHNGHYQFKAKACVKSIAVLKYKQTSRCSNNFSDEVIVTITGSAVEDEPNVSMPKINIENHLPSEVVRLAHASLQPTTGSFRVTESGAASYSVPIALPAGITGVQPEVSLNYSSQGGDGLVAMGWSLSAASGVARCRQTKAQDGQFRGLTLSDEDRYCLDGQRLISKAVHTHGGSFDGEQIVDEFMTEIDSYTTIYKLGYGSQAQFVVLAKDGSVKRYGASDNSRHNLTDADGTKHTMSWMLSEIQDNLGQASTTVNYVYEELVDKSNAANTEKVLAEINYSGNRVVFTHTSGELRQVGYIDEARTTQFARLNNIQVFNHQGTELANYQLGFADAANGVRLLESIAHCRGTVCRAPVTFKYDKFATDLSFEAFRQVYFKERRDNALASITLADLKGSGQTQLVTLEQTDKGAMRYKLCVYQGHTYRNAEELACQNIYRKDDHESVSLFAIDHDLDGKQTLMVNMRSEHTSDANPGYWAHYALSDNNVLQYQALPEGWSNNQYMREIKPADMNGDGYADLVYKQKKDDPNLYVRLTNPQTKVFGAQFTLHTKENSYGFGAYGDFTSKGSDWHVIDMNFDGLADIVSLKCESSQCDNDDAKRISVHYNQGQTASGGFERFLAQDVASDEKIELLTPSDVNGDGLVDLIYLATAKYNHNVKYWHVLLNQSSERVSFKDVFNVVAKSSSNDNRSVSELIPPMSMDVDKDGKADLFFKEKTNKRWRRYEWSPAQETFEKITDNAFELAVDTRGGDFAFFSDYNNDGVADILIKHNYGVSVRYNLSQLATAGMLREVNQGYAGQTNTTVINYGFMSDTAVYTDLEDELTSDSGRFNDQQLLVSKMIGAGVLVQSVETDSPSNRDGALSADKAKVEYHYQGARVQFGGRGPLGFKTLKTTTQKDGSTFETTTRYHQAFPLTGMPYSTQKTMLSAGSGVLLSKAVNEYSVSKTQQLGDVTAYRVYNSDSRECSAVVNTNMSVGAYTCTETTTVQDNHGNVKNLTVNTYDVGASGAEYFTAVSAGGDLQRTVTTVNEYGTTDLHKRLGRLSNTTVTYAGQGQDSMTKKSHFEYYPLGHAHENMLYKEVVGQGLGCEYELTTEHSYDALGNKVKVASTNTGCSGAERETRTSETIFDAEGRYVLYTKQSGSNSTLSLISGKVVENGQGVADRNAFGQPLSVIDNNGVVTELLYDHFGGEIGSFSNTGAQAYSYYTACGENENCAVRLNKEVNGVLREQHLLDKLGRAYSVRKLTVLNNQWLTSWYQFDQYGRNDVIKEAGSHAVTKHYDALDRVTSVVDSNNGTTSVTSIAGRETKVTITGTDIAAQVKTSLSNAIGQTVQVIDAQNQTLDYVYNALGDQVTVSSSAESYNQQLLSTIHYDKMGRKSLQQDADRGSWSYEYNAFGELVSQTDARGVVLTMKYDFLGRKVKQTQTTPSGVVNEGNSEWVYGKTNDTVHQLISSTQGSSWKQTYYYDTFGRAAATLTSLDGTAKCADKVKPNETTADLRITDGSTLDPIENSCVIQQSFYDSYSRLALQFDDYRRTEQGKFIEARGVAMTYQNGQLLEKREARNSNTGQVYYKVAALNERGQVTQYEKGGVTMNISYDQQGMVETISDSSRNIQNDIYSFDSLGNLKTRSQIGMAVRTYHYDDLNRVLGVNQVDLFKYSASGNLIEKADYLVGTDIECPGYGETSVMVLGRWTQRYGESNAPLHGISSRSRVSNSGCFGTLPGKTESFRYDANGNQVERVGSDGTTSIAYSARNKAIEISGNGETVTFSYDANNSRYKRVDNTNTVYYVGALELTIPKAKDGQSVINRYIGNDAQQTYYDTGLSKTKWLFTDHQGSTIAVTNSEHKVLTRYAYDIFGKQREVESNPGLMGDVFSNINDNLRAYTGHEPVSLGGDKRIVHMNGRIYDSETGRFMQADPFVQAPTNLQNYNAYSYVLNNPLSYTDPSGYLFKKLGKFIKKYWRPMLAIVVAYYTGDWANGLELFTSSIANGAVTGAIAGGAAGAVGSGSLKGALTGAATGAVFGAIGANFTGAAEGSFEHIASHALAGGVLAEIQGQNFGHGFWSAGLTKGMDVNGFMPGVGATMNMARTLVAGIIGGTVSKLVGGKFANGAVTAAFAQAFNGNSFWDRAKELGEFAIGELPGADLVGCMRNECSKMEWTLAVGEVAMTIAGGGAVTVAYKAWKVSRKVQQVTKKPVIRVKDSTKGQSEQNYDILNMNRAGFENHLVDSGLSKRTIPTKKGDINVFSDTDGKKVYTTRGFATKSGDYDGPTAEMFGADGKKRVAKIRIKGEEY
ncbi:SpvB/TcaC N-terminal domain-containing protein [Pseudoalteromonas rubra]|uniref:SpvB/TcaC N-terminal domain-containing protein n=1 Tax=Pseudoalteromonas rubra TaxID=43658 RepID=UPI0024B58285|nr:SpvB/TcaC N-terminal domain-containing protein [Pseudoalteromonas rubra]